MHETKSDDNYVWNSGSNKEGKNNYSKIKIAVISLFVMFITCLFLLFVDIFLFYKSNIGFFKVQKTSFEILGLKVSRHLSDKDIVGLKEDLTNLKTKRIEIIQKFYEYENKPLFRLFGITRIFSKIEMAFDLFIPISEEIINIQKSYNDVFDGRVGSVNPIKEMKKSTDRLVLLLDKLQIEIDSVNFIFLSDEIRSDILVIKNNIKLINNLLIDISKYSDLITNFTGESGLSTLAILFQNSNELRPTGGFIGSFMIVKFNNGNLVNYKLHDIYEFDGQLYEKTEAPYEGQLLVGNKSWSLRDSNINPDLEISAKNFNNFFEKAGGETIDNFIFIDKTLISDFLQVLGPIELENYEIGVNSDNFDFVIQYFVEGSKGNAFFPAKFILLNDFYNAFTGKIFNCLKEDNLSCFVNFYKLKDKLFSSSSLQLISLHSNVNDIIKESGFQSGLLKDNFIAPIFTSISGNKSDKFVKTYYEMRKKSDFEFSLEIMRSHEWTRESEDRWQYLSNNFSTSFDKNKLKDIMGYGGNRSVLQVYVPIDYTLLMSSGENISTLEGKKIINFSSKNWQRGSLNVYEIELPIIYTGDSIIVTLDFKSEKRILEVDIWKQPGLIVY